MSTTIYTAAFGAGGGTSRYGDFVVVRLPNCSFITTPMELQQVSTWARGRMSSGMASRDRDTFIGRFETIIGRSGSAVATRGSRGVLARILKSMKANSLIPAEWVLPHDINDSVEVKKKEPVAAVVAAVLSAVAVPKPA